MGRRKEDWPERLLALVDARRRTPFAYGVQDCCLFAADCARAMTGADPAAAYRGRYRTWRGAHRALRSVLRLPARPTASGGRPSDGPGGASMVEAAWRRALGEPIAPAFAQRGDVALIATPAGDAAGVVVGGLVAWPGEKGLVFGPLAAARLAFRV